MLVDLELPNLVRLKFGALSFVRLNYYSVEVVVYRQPMWLDWRIVDEGYENTVAPLHIHLERLISGTIVAVGIVGHDNKGAWTFFNHTGCPEIFALSLNDALLL